jgi:hypothetical protein
MVLTKNELFFIDFYMNYCLLQQTRTPMFLEVIQTESQLSKAKACHNKIAGKNNCCHDADHMVK